MSQHAVQNRHLGVFAKYWEPGAVKTRLAQRIGKAAAASLYHEFLQCLVARFARIGDERTLAFWPGDRRHEFAALGGDAWQLELQAGDDLGQRMKHFFERRFAQSATTPKSASAAVLIGSDSPTMRFSVLTSAFQALEEFDIVLGPTSDGGYYLVGMSAAHVAIFDDIEWSTPAVWKQTVERTEQLGLRHFVLPSFFDVDEVDDLARLLQDIAEFDQGESLAVERLRAAVSQLQPPFPTE